MIDARPELIDAAPDDLRSLSSTLTGYGLAGTHSPTWGIWLLWMEAIVARPLIEQLGGRLEYRLRLAI